MKFTTNNYRSRTVYQRRSPALTHDSSGSRSISDATFHYLKAHPNRHVKAYEIAEYIILRGISPLPDSTIRREVMQALDQLANKHHEGCFVQRVLTHVVVLHRHENPERQGESEMAVKAKSEPAARQPERRR